MPCRQSQRKCLTKRKARSKSAPAVLRSPSKRTVKRKQWTDAQMESAIEAVSTGKSGVNQAAMDHRVPRTTLKDRLSGRVKHGQKPGPVKYLSSEEENELAGFLKQCAAVGYGKTRQDVMNIAQSVASEKGILRGNRISHGWWQRFIQRQKDLSLRRGEKEKKKKSELEERERKEEREAKKKLKQQEAAQKAEEREKKKRLREEEQKRKAHEKEQKRKQKEKSQRKTTATSIATSVSSSNSSSTISDKVATGQKRKSSQMEVPPPKKICTSAEEEIDPNVCCMCFQNYNEDVVNGAGTDWISCACGRWLHEDCADDRVVNDEGKELFCPFCVI